MKERKRNRLEGFDYSQDNLYFVTSCVQDRICCFGEITDKQMILNEYGHIARQQWDWLGQQYPYILLHAFVVMPNHIHGIIEINRNAIDFVRTGRDGIVVGTGRDGIVVGTGRDPSLQQLPKIKSLSEIMGAYKTTTSKKIHLTGFTRFAWQRSFHDHIIRNDQSFERIADYIHTNPAKWKEDTFHSF
ncbi:MAG: hypothetical protein K0S33_4124 [Bacteroidetes bacterium]|nr:hypothetical protein [Bacteroidota bacterium]